MRKAPESLRLRPSGRLEADTCGELRLQLAAAFAAGVTEVVVDLIEVDALDVTGLGVLDGAAQHLQANDGSLTVVNPSADVSTSLRINGLGSLVTLPTRRPLRVVPPTPRSSGSFTQGLKKPS